MRRPGAGHGSAGNSAERTRQRWASAGICICCPGPRGLPSHFPPSSRRVPSAYSLAGAQRPQVEQIRRMRIHRGSPPLCASPLGVGAGSRPTVSSRTRARVGKASDSELVLGRGLRLSRLGVHGGWVTGPASHHSLLLPQVTFVLRVPSRRKSASSGEGCLSRRDRLQPDKGPVGK